MTNIVVITWEDSFSMDNWQTRQGAIANTERPMTCQTIGFVLKESKDTITVCHTANEEDQVCGVMQIPRRCIVKIRKLK
jgi:hypothetical protein